jgi:tetratricopeptide (TPR) repeat protein
MAVQALPADALADSVGRPLLRTFEILVAGELALQRGQWEAAAELLEDAAVAQDELQAQHHWLQPARQVLGACYLKGRRPAAAERIFREDLERWPENGWSLYGLHRALVEQGRQSEAVAVKARFEQAWARADRPIATSTASVQRL